MYQGPPPQQYPQQGPPQGRPGPPSVVPPGSPYPLFVSTMNDAPGLQVERICGEVFGLTVRSRDIGANWAAGFTSLGGGEVTEYTRLLSESRHVAIMRMCEMAQSLGANAILAMRFDCNEIANTMSEVAAYGTGVVLSVLR